MRAAIRPLLLLNAFLLGSCGAFESDKRSPPPIPEISVSPEDIEAAEAEEFAHVCEGRGGVVEGELCRHVAWFLGLGTGVFPSIQERELPDVTAGTKIVAEGTASAELFLDELSLGRVPLETIAPFEGKVRLQIEPGFFENFNVWAEECVRGTSLEPVACPFGSVSLH